MRAWLGGPGQAAGVECNALRHCWVRAAAEGGGRGGCSGGARPSPIDAGICVDVAVAAQLHRTLLGPKDTFGLDKLQARAQRTAGPAMLPVLPVPLLLAASGTSQVHHQHAPPGRPRARSPRRAARQCRRA